MACLRPFARGFAGLGLVAAVLCAASAGADPLQAEDPDDLSAPTHGLDAVTHTDGASLDSLDDGGTEALDAADDGHTVTLDAADSGSTVGLDAADTGHSVSLDAADVEGTDLPGPADR